MKRLVPLLICVLLTASCRQTTVLTEGEKIAQQVGDLVGQYNIQQIAVFYGNGSFIPKQAFSFQGAFLRLSDATGDRYFSFARLTRFDVGPASSGPPTYLTLYFQ